MSKNKFLYKEYFLSSKEVRDAGVTGCCQTSEKYSTDCFTLNMFINGDNSSIKELFTKPIPTTNANSEHAIFEPQTRHQSIAELSAIVHEFLEKINNLEIKLKEQEKKNAKNEETIDQLLKKYERLQNHHDQMRHEHTSKLTTLETFKKRADDSIKSIGEFDNDINEIKLQQIRDSVKKLTNKMCSPQIQVTERTQQNLLSTTETSRTLTLNNENPENIEIDKTNQKPNDKAIKQCSAMEKSPTETTTPPASYSSLLKKPSTAKQDKQTEKQKPTKISKTSNTEAKHQEVIVDLTINDHENKKHSQPTEMNTPTLSEQKTHHNGNTNTNNDEFRGYHRQKKTRLFVDNIHKSSTFGGLLEFLKDKHKLHPSGIKLFRSKRSGHQAAKIHLYPEEADKVISDEFKWPQGITCDLWLTHDEANKKMNVKQRSNEKKNDFSGYEESNETPTRRNRDSYHYSYDKTENKTNYGKSNNQYAGKQTYNRDEDDDDDYSENHYSYYEGRSKDNYNNRHNENYNTRDNIR